MKKKAIVKEKKAAGGRLHAPTIAPKVVRKSISQTRRDIADWRNAIRIATLASEPKQVLLQELYDDITNDALLSSQINNRHEQTISSPFELVDEGGNVNDTLTAQLNEIAPLPDIVKMILESELYGYSVVELSENEAGKQAALIPRRNIDPTFGRFYPDTSFNTYIPYREAAEYGKFLLEFNAGHLGVLNKAVPHILFKKFAQSCWSELCEIFGIPPRYMKTNTQDAGMLDRAENMMRELGAAAWFIIDTTEDFQFADGVSTNGDVYNNLIRLCNNETSMLISGAIMGQDTENGNYSKEAAAIGILARLIEADKRMAENYMNNTVIPAFYRIGWLPATTCRFRFSAVEDTDKLWTLTKEILPYKEVASEWITEKFGIPVSDKVSSPGLPPQLSAGGFFA
jgi:phage gp29-like protein